MMEAQTADFEPCPNGFAQKTSCPKNHRGLSQYVLIKIATKMV